MIHLEEGEKVIYSARKHWIIFANFLVPVIIMAFIPLIAIPFLPEIAEPLTTKLGDALIGLYFLWLLILWNLIFVEWIDFYLDIWYVTNTRIIDVEQEGLFKREIISVRFENIQDIAIQTDGILHSLLNFGNLIVETAGHESHIEIKNVTNPDLLKKEILRVQQKTHTNEVV